MDILQDVEEYINEINQAEGIDFAIDSIRVEFSKQHKLTELKQLGRWMRLEKNSNILYKLKKRLTDNEITTAYQLEKHSIYYYNMQDAPKYRKAIMVIFGMKQYHKEPPPRNLIEKILTILKDVSNIDVCLDVPFKPNLNKISNCFALNRFTTDKGVKTDTYYINTPDILGMEKMTIYNKALKNELQGILWRFEAKILIHNIKALYMPLHEFKELIEKGR